MDIEQLRSETPGCRHVLHFNNAGASLMPRPVLETVVNYLNLEAEMGGYEAANRMAAQLEGVYDSIARLLNCHRDEVAVIENATRAWDMAFYAIPFQPGDRILTSQSEYASNYIAYLQMARQKGVTVETIPTDDFGQVSVSALEGMMDSRVKLIAVTHIPTNGGLVNPAEAIGEVARRHNVLYLLDACQSAGQMPLDVTRIQCDMLSATSRKYLRGPRGMGFLYVRKAVIGQLEPPLLDLHAAEWVSRDAYTIRGDARRFENWETNFAAKLGMGAAVEYALNLGLDTIWSRVALLGQQLRTELSRIDGITIRDLGQTQCGIVSFTSENMPSDAIYEALQAQNINVSYSPRQYTRLDMEARELESIVRASVHYYNTEAEIARFCNVLADSVKQQPALKGAKG